MLGVCEGLNPVPLFLPLRHSELPSEEGQLIGLFQGLLALFYTCLLFPKISTYVQEFPFLGIFTSPSLSTSVQLYFFQGPF